MAPVVEAYQAMRGVAFLTAVTFVAEIGDVRRFRDTAAVNGLSWISAVRTLDRRTNPTRQNYQSRQPKSPPSSDRGRLDISLSGSSESVFANKTREAAQQCTGYCLEGPGAAVCALSQIDGSRQTPVLNYDGNSTRNGGLPMGNRS